MNKVVLTGNISSDIELRKTNSGKYVTSFSLAVRRPKVKDVTDFLTIVCWEKTAEFVSKYFKKGSGIEVSGILTARKWDDKDGNKRISVEVTADEVDFGKNSSSDNNDDSSVKDTSNTSKHEDFEEIEDYDDDVPF